MERQGVGAVIKREREVRGWKRAELARRSGLSGGYINRVEEGSVKVPGVDQVQRIAAAFGISPDELLTPAIRDISTAPNSYVVRPVVQVPIVNITLAAGQAVYGETNETISVTADLAPGRRLIGARVVGNCMEPEIMAGDVAIVDIADRSPRDEDLVVLLLEDGSMAVKRFRQRDSEPFLVDNKGGEYRPNDAKIQGLVVAIERRYR